MAKRAIFITGASSGIGLASVIRLHNLDFRIFAGVFPGEDTTPLDSLDDVKLIPIDVTNSDMIASAAQTIARETNGAGLYGLFNNAGIPVTGPMEFTPMAALRKQMEVNLFGHIEVTQRMLPYLRQAAPARIINTTSLLGRIVVPFCGPYSISKYGMEAFSDALRYELRPSGISVSIIEPGAIATPIWARTRENVDEMLSELSPQAAQLYGEQFKHVAKVTEKQGKNGLSPDEVAKVVVHAFTSKRPKIRYVVGQDAKTITFLRRVCTDRMFDWLIRRLYRSTADKSS